LRKKPNAISSELVFSRNEICGLIMTEVQSHT
jgi:hypothetical protein